jgi:hypothetical protein
MMKALAKQGLAYLRSMPLAEFEGWASEMEQELSPDQFLALVRVMNRGLARRFPATPPRAA